MKRNLIIVAIFLVGLSVFAYPLISNVISTGTHATVISKYEEDLKKMSKKEIEQMKEDARQHNEKEINPNMIFTDPFAEGGEDESNTSSGYYNLLNVGETMGSLEIPKINVDLPIYHGASDDVLRDGIGHLGNSSLPVGGADTHAILTAHRGLPSSKLFRELDQIKIGDKFFVHTLDETLAYQVDDIKIVLPNETGELVIEDGRDLVTLVTCDPYMINTHRMLVRGERIPYDPDEEGVRKPDEKPSFFSKIIKELLILGGLLIIILLFILKRRKKKKDSTKVEVD